MATPSKKAEVMEMALINLTGHDRRETIKADRCVPAPFGCYGPAHEFRDEISKREFTISGLCQECQDKAFSEDQ